MKNKEADKTPAQQTSFDEAKVVKAIEATSKIINKHQLTIRELLILWGNMAYHIGASIAGIQNGKGPDINTLKKHYYTNPTVDIGLMLQGLMITDWEADFVKKPVISNIAEQYNRSEKKE